MAHGGESFASNGTYRGSNHLGCEGQQSGWPERVSEQDEQLNPSSRKATASEVSLRGVGAEYGETSSASLSRQSCVLGESRPCRFLGGKVTPYLVWRDCGHRKAARRARQLTGISRLWRRHPQSMSIAKVANALGVGSMPKQRETTHCVSLECGSEGSVGVLSTEGR